MNSDETTFQPENLDELIEHPTNDLAPEDQHLLFDMKHVHQGYESKNTQSLRYVWSRLEVERRKQSRPETAVVQNEPIPIVRKKQTMNYSPSMNHSLPVPFRRMLSLLVASIVVVLLVGSAIVFFNRADQSHHVSHDPQKIQPTNIPGANSSGIYIVYSTDTPMHVALSKVNAQTHKTLWVYQNNLSDITTPVINGDMVYISAMDEQNRQAHLIALNATTGKELWNVPFKVKDLKLPGDNASVYDTLTAPAVVDGQVFVLSRSGAVFSLDAKTGKQNWTYTTGSTGVKQLYYTNTQTGEQMPRGSMRLDGSTPVVSKGVLYGALQNTYFAVNVQTGKQIWSLKIKGENQVLTGVSVANGAIYTASIKVSTTAMMSAQPGSVYALNIKDGSQIWQYSPGEVVEGIPEVSNGHVYFVTDRFPNPSDFYTKNVHTTLHALDLQSHEVWHKDYNAHIGAQIVDDGYISVSTQTYDTKNASPLVHTLYVYDANGNSRQKVAPGDPTAIQHGVLYTLSGSAIIAYDLHSLQAQWQEHYGAGDYSIHHVIVFP